ncbi:tripartite tricarboxylate transporter TctB family protein [Halomonas sp. PR-M31]|uniref:tripartite tricarboxylate transporter TctB family protein n=1 Tax=Halomonas sp. PR-M31 TaxID=1471202 RepID=UPI000650E0A0|nr:tripartite tricarboxylate transporter TctB family protein [Halomonas sp. PR-M31]
MNDRRHLLTVIATLLFAIGLAVVSFLPDVSGYKFPQMIALSIVAIAAIMVLLALIPKKPLTKVDEESIPWGSIWPLLLILVGFLVIMERLGFFVTSFIAFFLIVMIYSPQRLGWRGAIKSGVIAAIFMAVLYLVFVSLLSVQTPQGLLI